MPQRRAVGAGCPHRRSAAVTIVDGCLPVLPVLLYWASAWIDEMVLTFGGTGIMLLEHRDRNVFDFQFLHQCVLGCIFNPG